MKKTNKPNPLKVFNDNKAMAYKKAGGEMAAYKKSLKQFQGEGDSEVNMMINKPGSTGGYQKSRSIFAPPAGMNIPSIAEQMASKSSVNNVDLENARAAASARAAAIQGTGARNIANSISKVQSVQPPMSVYDKKRGGTVKTKKRK
jgi:hypothetical protein